jgi:M6 family metalloprotease-like protein
VTTLAFVVALACSPGAASAAPQTPQLDCSAQAQAARTAAVRRFQRTMPAQIRAYFRHHHNKRQRRAFVRAMKRRLAELRQAAEACGPSSGTTGESAPDPAPPSCSPSLFSAPYTEMNEGTTNSELPLRPDGQVRAVMLFVDFPDLHGSESMTALYDRLVPAAKRWFKEVSYDRLRFDATPVMRWHRMPRRVGSYSLADGISWQEHFDYIGDAVRAADADFDFSPYQIVYVVAPKGSGIERSPAFHAYPGSGIKADGSELRAGATFFEDTRFNAGYAANVLIHETGHILGLPDLYDVPDPTYWRLFRFAGSWDMMSWNDPGAHFLAWNKWKLGWLDSSQLTCLEGPGEVTTTITPLERPGGLKAIVVPMGTTSTYVIEARKRIGEDSDLCETGVLVYSVDSTIRGGNGPIRVRAAQRDTSPDLLNRCGPLYNAPFDKAEGEDATFEDPTAGFSVRVLSSGPNGYRVNVTRTSLTAQSLEPSASASGSGGVESGESLAPPYPLLPAPFPFGMGLDLGSPVHAR